MPLTKEGREAISKAQKSRWERYRERERQEQEELARKVLSGDYTTPKKGNLDEMQERLDATSRAVLLTLFAQHEGSPSEFTIKRYANIAYEAALALENVRENYRGGVI